MKTFATFDAGGDGASIANALARGLARLDVAVTEVQSHEDYGWEFDAGGCRCLLQYVERWLVIVEGDSSVLERLLGKRAPAERLEVFLGKLREVLGGAAFTNVRWFTRAEYEDRRVLRESERGDVLWSLHCALDAVEDADAGASADAIMRRLELSGDQRPDVRGALLDCLGDEPDEVAMDDVLAKLTETVPIEWLDDVTRLPRRRRDEIVARCTTLLEQLRRPSMPQAFARDVIAQLEDVLGELPDREQVEVALVGLFINDLWRSQGRERELAASIVATLERKARVRFEL